LLPTACLLALAGGCGVFDSVPRGADSLLQVFEGPTPTEAADLALDRPLVGLTARPEFLTRCGIALIG
jgi:hypothetical protein